MSDEYDRWSRNGQKQNVFLCNIFMRSSIFFVENIYLLISVYSVIIVEKPRCILDFFLTDMIISYGDSNWFLKTEITYDLIIMSIMEPLYNQWIARCSLHWM